MRAGQHVSLVIDHHPGTDTPFRCS
jgi:hypothetical protein